MRPRAVWFELPIQGASCGESPLDYTANWRKPSRYTFLWLHSHRQSPPGIPFYGSIRVGRVTFGLCDVETPSNPWKCFFYCMHTVLLNSTWCTTSTRTFRHRRDHQRSLLFHELDLSGQIESWSVWPSSCCWVGAEKSCTIYRSVHPGERADPSPGGPRSPRWSSAPVLSLPRERAVVWGGRGATARPWEAKWSSGVAGVFWV